MYFEKSWTVSFWMFMIVNFVCNFSMLNTKHLLKSNKENINDLTCKYNVLGQNLNESRAKSANRSTKEPNTMKTFQTTIKDFIYKSFNINDVFSKLDSAKIRINNTKRQVIHVGGLFDMEGNRKVSHGHSELVAAEIAVDHINKINFIPNYQLKLLANNSKVQRLSKRPRRKAHRRLVLTPNRENQQVAKLVLPVADNKAQTPLQEDVAEILLSLRDPVEGIICFDEKENDVVHIETTQEEKRQCFEHDTPKCDPGVGTDAFYDLIYRNPQIVMVMGSACSEVTETLAEIVPYWNLILVSYASTSPALSEREKYKTFFRLAPTDSANNPARRLFVQHFGWKVVAILYEDIEIFYLAIDGLSKALEHHNISISKSISFRSKEEGEIKSKIQTLVDEDARIIIGAFSEIAARQVLCEAYNAGLFGSRYVWMFIGEFVEKWWEVVNDTSCTTEQLRLAAEGYFTVASFNALNGKGMSFTNISVEKFVKDYKQLNGTMPMSPYAKSAYDTLWTIALTLRTALYQKNTENSSSVDLGQFTYANGKETTGELFKIMEKLSFKGLSGPVSFKGPDRRGIAVLSQNQGGEMETIAMYEPDKAILKFNCSECVQVMWQGERIPRDQVVKVLRNKVIDDHVFYITSSCSLVGIIASVSFLAFNLYHRKLRYIKLSSPNLNNVALCGCIFVYGGVLVLGLDDKRLKEEFYPAICTIRAFLFAAGFSLSFGAMFTKTYRVHQIFTRAHNGLVKNKLLKDKQLMFIICVLLLLDSTIVLVWVFVDPMNRRISNLTVEPSEVDKDILYIYQLSTCHSLHMDKWMGSFYAVKGLLLVFGVYMAWETRHVKIPVLNDSQYIGLNVYNVVIMSALVVVISNILSDKPTLAYTMESSFMLISTSVTLCLLFGPKVYAIVTSNGNPVIASSGILVEDKTRRFVVDERREKYYRAEVQNRVYKREIVELDQEISRLERLLEMPLQPYPKITDELLYLLPESRVDPTPSIKRRKHKDLESWNSISDGGEVCLGISDELSDDASLGPSLTIPKIKPPRRMSIVEAATLTAKKLTDFRRSLSFRSPSRRHQYTGLLPQSPLSPTNNDDFLSPLSAMIRPIPKGRRLEKTCSAPFTPKHQTEATIVESSSEYSEARNSTDELSHADSPTENHLPVPKWHIEVTPVSEDEENVCISQASLAPCFVGQERKPYKSRKFSKSSDTLCRVTDIDSPKGDKPLTRLQTIDTLLSNERRQRIKKLQTDLNKIQRELLDLEELEYTVSKV